MKSIAVIAFITLLLFSGCECIGDDDGISINVVILKDGKSLLTDPDTLTLESFQYNSEMNFGHLYTIKNGHLSLYFRNTDKYKLVISNQDTIFFEPVVIVDNSQQCLEHTLESLAINGDQVCLNDCESFFEIVL